MTILVIDHEWPQAVRRVVFAESRGRGCVIVERPLNRSNLPEGVAGLYNLCVEPEYRHKGVGKALMDAAEQWCRDNGFEAVQLEWSETESERWTLDWYGSRGYETVTLNTSGTYYKLEKRLN